MTSTGLAQLDISDTQARLHVRNRRNQFDVRRQADSLHRYIETMLKSQRAQIASRREKCLRDMQYKLAEENVNWWKKLLYNFACMSYDDYIVEIRQELESLRVDRKASRK